MMHNILRFASFGALLVAIGCGGGTPSNSPSGGVDENPFASSGGSADSGGDLEPTTKKRKKRNRSVSSRPRRNKRNSNSRKSTNQIPSPAYGSVSEHPVARRGLESTRSQPSTSPRHDQKPVQEHPLSALLGQPAPNLDIKLPEGGVLNLQNRNSSQVLVVVIWATYSKLSKKEFDAIEKVRSDLFGKNVKWLAVNDGEKHSAVSKYLARQKVDIPIGYDLDQEVADAFQASQLPFLAIIDTNGVIQSLHPGYSTTLDIELRSELFDLTSGRDIIEKARDRLNHGPKLRRQTKTSPGQQEPSDVANDDPVQVAHQAATFELKLDSGRTIDLKQIFSSKGKEFEVRLGRMRRKGSVLTSYYEGRKPKLLVGNTGGRLNGPTAAFYPDGTPMIYLDYVVGNRAGTLFTWDDQRRPWVFAQYDSGKKDGYACAFRACGDECTDGHIWLIQEWENDKLRKSHLAEQDGDVVTYDHLESSDHLSNNEYAEAAAQINRFEKDLATNEIGLKKTISQYGRQVARARRAAARASMQRSMASMMGGGSGIRVSVPRIRIRTGGSC